MRWIAVSITALCLGNAAAAQDGADFFTTKACAVCHEIGPGAGIKVGPPLNGILDAPVARLEDFR